MALCCGRKKWACKNGTGRNGGRGMQCRTGATMCTATCNLSFEAQYGGQIVKNGLHMWCCCYSSVTCDLVGHSQVKLRCESGRRHESWVRTQQHESNFGTLTTRRSAGHQLQLDVQVTGGVASFVGVHRNEGTKIVTVHHCDERAEWHSGGQRGWLFGRLGWGWWVGGRQRSRQLWCLQHRPRQLLIF